MDVAALVVSVIAAGVAAVAAVFTRRSSLAARRSADAAERVDHRAGTPALTVALDESRPADEWTGTYVIRNGGPVDLDGVTVEIADAQAGRAGSTFVFSGDESGPRAKLGPLRVAESRVLVTMSGAEEVVYVRAVVTAGGRSWSVPLELPPAPRPFRIL